MKKNIYVSIICFLLLVMIFSGVMIYSHFKEAHTQEEIYDSLAEFVEENETSEAVNTTEGEVVMLPEYTKLFEQNSDIVGWIRIDDTQINYPVMQSPQESNFYLKHGFDKEYTDYGCPYMSESCDVNKPSDNLIVYGHHMKNGTMFSDLERFKKKEFWEEHKTFRFDTLYVNRPMRLSLFSRRRFIPARKMSSSIISLWMPQCRSSLTGISKEPKKRLSTIRAFLPNTVISSSRYPPVSILVRTAGLS